MFYLIFIYFIIIIYCFHRASIDNIGLVPLPNGRERLAIVNDLIHSNFSYPAYTSDKKQSFAIHIFESYDYICIQGGISADFVQNLLRKIAINEHFCRLWIENYKNSGVYSDVLSVFYWYESKAVRNIKDWAIGNKSLPVLEDYFSDLIPFLFEKYEVPLPLRNVWRYWDFYEEKELSIKVGFTEKSIEQLTLSDLVIFNWYFAVAQGENLRKNAYLPFEMSKNALYYFYSTPKDYSLMQAFRWSKTKGMGANDAVAKLMAAELPYFNENEKVVEEITYLLMRSGDFDEKEARKAVRFLKVTILGDYCHEYDEDNYFLSYLLPYLSLKGKNVASVLRYKELVLKQMPKLNNFIPIHDISWRDFLTKRSKLTFDFFNNIIFMTPLESALDKSVLIWNISIGTQENVVSSLKLSTNASMDQSLDFRIALMMTLKEVSLPSYPALPNVPDIFYYKNNLEQEFEVVRLQNYLELYREGRILDHCVADYDTECLKGTSSIWSLRQVEKDGTLRNRITVEWCTENKCLNQAQGFQNADPEPYEHEVIDAWQYFIHNPSENLNPKKMQGLSEMAVPA